MAGNPDLGQRILTDIDAALEGLTEAVGRFQESMSTHLQGADVSCLRWANGKICDVVASKQREISEMLNDVFRQGKTQLPACQESVAASHDQAPEIDVDKDLTRELGSRPAEIVRKIRDENRQLRRKIVMANERLLEEVQRAEAAEQRVRIDALTQLPNRWAFEERLAECQAALDRYDQPYCLVLFDLDHFKSINDRFGHAAGDAVLSTVGRVFRSQRRTTDHICRTGGEEFALLLPHSRLEAAMLAAERFRGKIESATLSYKGRELGVTASAGVAEAVKGKSGHDLLESADAALYLAKSQGRNQVCVEGTFAAENRV